MKDTIKNLRAFLDAARLAVSMAKIDNPPAREWLDHREGGETEYPESDPPSSPPTDETPVDNKPATQTAAPSDPPA